MRRSILLQVTVYCPHFQRPVAATQNEAIARLVSCDGRDSCRKAPPGGTVEEAPFPTGCPVYPQLQGAR